MPAGNLTDLTQGRPRGRPSWADKFIAGLEEHGTVSHACRVAGVSRQAAYNLRKADPRFAREWDDACEAVTDVLEKTLINRAIHGWEEPVFYKGEETGSRVRIDNELGWKLLRARRRGQYNPRVGEKDEGSTDVRDMATRIREAVIAMRATVPMEPPGATGGESDPEGADFAGPCDSANGAAGAEPEESGPDEGEAG